MSARGRFSPGQVLFGGDWSPEQWDPATWDEDLALMARARVNTVTLGVFSWSSLEPTEGAFVTDWLDEILERLTAAGIGFFLATPTAERTLAAKLTGRRRDEVHTLQSERTG